MRMIKWFLLALLAVVATIVDQFVMHYTTGIAGWPYIFIGWFVAWLVCFLIFNRRWLFSIAAVLIISVIEDASFLLWDRIMGRTPWSSQWYCHDWMVGFSQNWAGIPSHYIYSLIIAGCLIWIGFEEGRYESKPN